MARSLSRYPWNPILRPDPRLEWQASGVFNPGVVQYGGEYVMVYRALSVPIVGGPEGSMVVSSLGMATSTDGKNFRDIRFFFGPEYEWEAYGVEDPRVVKVKRRFFIFYTAVSSYPPRGDAVKTALAVTHDFEDYEKWGVVIPFQSKAATLFPRKIGGQYVLMFTADPERPPSKVVLAYLDKLEDMTDPAFWEEWKREYERGEHRLFEAIPPQEYVEVGAPPIETEYGWLLVRPEIAPGSRFSIHATLLDLDDPAKIIADSGSLLVPEAWYEINGKVPYVVFPSGALIIDDVLHVYYGAADTYVALATIDMDDLWRLLGVGP